MDLDHHRGGSGEPLVLIHGVGHTWRGWKPMLPLLERDFDVLAVDLPGFGRSPSLPAGTEPTPEALAFLDTLPHTFGGHPKGLNQIDVPVTILWGTRDLLLLPRQAKRFERLIPNAELRYLDGLGHTPMSDDPELLAELLATTSRAPRAVAPA